ncbi:3-keto-disaccharide hydrolase [Puia sp. P3]|uniref:3-keto-disaccharide hydrolase n=1 Tax=Puia sp. P3 TaxID=3423952 RepID=UPI003D66DF8A
MRFSIPPQWENEDRNLDVEGSVRGDSLEGTMVMPDGETPSWVGYPRASVAARRVCRYGVSRITLFNGKDLSGWHVMGKTNQWVVEGGILRSPRPGSNIVTDQKFTDFRLHVEFRYPKGGNSGVYLRGRYEVQIEDEEGGGVAPNEVIGGVYGFLPPVQRASKGPGVWQTCRYNAGGEAGDHRF